MSRIGFNRKKAKLRSLLGVRARLVLLSLILIGPLMIERLHSLDAARAQQIAEASQEFVSLAQHNADAQREVLSSVEAMLKSAAYIRASAGGVSRSCNMLRESLKVELPWIRSMSIIGKDGHVQCSTLAGFVGTDLSDQPYFKRMMATRGFVLSDYLFGRVSNQPTMIAAYPVSAVDQDEDAFVVATINLHWMSKAMENLGNRPGVSAVLIDGAGTVIAAPPKQAGLIGRKLDSLPLLAAIADKAIDSPNAAGSVSFAAADGTKRELSYARVAGTSARIVVSIDEAQVTADINRQIRYAYLQLAFVCMLVLLCALFAAEKLIIEPIDTMAVMAKRFGRGDWAARAQRRSMPAEFVPLARAFNGMAAQLGARERELVATNDRLTVIASIDMLSGLANRRGFQGRLDFEWAKAQQADAGLALMMIDVDHFKLFNDSHGHPEGDACLRRIGETLAGLAERTGGFACRYGGEEFCLLLPNASLARGLQVGEMIRAAVTDLAIPHRASNHRHVTVSIGVACVTPNHTQQPMDLIEAADAALYVAKRRGRNTVIEHGFGPATDDGMIAVAI